MSDAVPGGDVSPEDPQADAPEVDVPLTETDEHDGPPNFLEGATARDLLLLIPILAKTIYSLAGIPLGTALQFTRPLYAELLRGSSISMVFAGAFAAGGRLPLWAVLVAPIPYMMFTDPLYFLAGRRFGRPLVAHLERSDRRWHRRARRVERFFGRWGLWTIVFAYWLPVPSSLLYFVAGDARIRFHRFIAADLVGTLSVVGFWVSLGYFIGKPAENVADAVGQYSGRISIALVVVIVVFSVVSGWRSVRTSAPRS
jgi:membrane protein DedA with SNARE-associated domain